MLLFFHFEVEPVYITSTKSYFYVSDVLSLPLEKKNQKNEL